MNLLVAHPSGLAGIEAAPVPVIVMVELLAACAPVAAAALVAEAPTVAPAPVVPQVPDVPCTLHEVTFPVATLYVG